MYSIIKILITAGVIVGVSELGKRFSPIAAILASLPLTSVLAMIWLYYDTRDAQKVIDLSTNIFWAVLPSLVFFVALPMLLKAGVKFGLAMILASGIMFGAYSVYVVVLKKFGVQVL